MNINFSRIILAVASISIVIAFIGTVFTKEVFPLMGVDLIILFLSPVGILSMIFYNNYRKKRDSKRFLPVDNSENLRAVIIYLAGFFVILFTPVIVVLVIAVIAEVTRLFHSSNEKLIVGFPLTVGIIISLAYIIMLENRKKLDDINALDTLKNSFSCIQLFSAGIIVFIAIDLHNIFTGGTPDDCFKHLEYILLLGITGIFSMPYMIFLNVISHISRPKADPYNE